MEVQGAGAARALAGRERAVRALGSSPWVQGSWSRPGPRTGWVGVLWEYMRKSDIFGFFFCLFGGGLRMRAVAFRSFWVFMGSFKSLQLGETGGQSPQDGRGTSTESVLHPRSFSFAKLQASFCSHGSHWAGTGLIFLQNVFC